MTVIELYHDCGNFCCWQRSVFDLLDHLHRDGERFVLGGLGLDPHDALDPDIPLLHLATAADRAPTVEPLGDLLLLRPRPVMAWPVAMIAFVYAAAKALR